MKKRTMDKEGAEKPYVVEKPHEVDKYICEDVDA
jgi:hypothetical protein